MAEVTVYVKPTCSKCRAVLALLEERGIAHDTVEYEATGLTAGDVRELVRMTGVPATELLRDTDEEGVTEDRAVALLVERPKHLQRPIVVRGERAVVARPPERALELLDA